MSSSIYFLVLICVKKAIGKFDNFLERYFMSEKVIVIFILGVLIFDFLIDLLLSFLNEKSSKNPIPNELSGIYDDEKYQESQELSKNYRSFCESFEYTIIDRNGCRNMVWMVWIFR